MNFQEILAQYWRPAFFAFGLSGLLTTIAIQIFPQFGLIDRPLLYGLKRKPIPYYGGIAIFLAFIVSVLIFVPISRQLVGLLVGALMIAAIGFWDDSKRISPLLRIGFHFLAALILVWSGIGILSVNIPFLGIIDMSAPLVGAIFTIFWVMAIVNTMNFVDGVSGLTSGIGFISGLTLFILSIHPGLHVDPQSQIGVATIALIVAMISLAFLIFDFPRPAILMGDTGSTLLGFVIATLAIFSGGKVATAFLVLGIPILDMIWVVLRRLWSGQKFWKGDLKHLHHRLLDLGLSERMVILIYLGVTAFFGFTSVVLVDSRQKLFMIIALGLMMLLLAVALVFGGRRRMD
ncbi:undecaprenyl/decaprenyl-phosphate alpha-N-acetylglucosaminyl 1-phosphate transferase [Candidatus Peregrinibacteria bacterium]|nr:undecaprenyl/decaprenyl-phosphate alpha-N-acetylglucosaminyl 1-phosphate transferase [Candidatus Peregrinibacteria bacterium]